MKVKIKYNPQLVERIKTIPGRRWDAQEKVWILPDKVSTLERLQTIAEEFNLEDIKIQVEKRLEKALQWIEASQATEPRNGASIPTPPGHSLYPFQIAGVEYAMARKSVLIADDMGLGKTVQAIALLNLHQPQRAIVVCPASVKGVWRDMLLEWLTYPAEVITVNNGSKKWLEPTDRPTVVVVNYDRLSRMLEKKVVTGKYGRKRTVYVAPESLLNFDFMIVDEAHYIKNLKAKRTKVVMDMAASIERKVFLTGTPILNRPVELFPILKAIDPKNWGDFWWYVNRYCAAHRTRFGWDYSGASNLEELQRELRASYMIRRKKVDVLKDLPPKIRQVVSFTPDTKELKAAIQEEGQWLGIVDEALQDGWRDVIETLMEASIPFEEIARVRHLTALAKVPQVIDFLENLLENKDKVVVFAHHRDVIEALKTHFGDACVTLMGGDSTAQRDRAVKEFQTNPNIKLFIGSLQACAEGLTLTAADTAVFAELDWVPGKVAQAEDRIHRIGQEANSVFYYYLVVDGSVDALVAKAMTRKLNIIETALD